MKKRTTFKMRYRWLIVKTVEMVLVFAIFLVPIFFAEMLCKLLGVG